MTQRLQRRQRGVSILELMVALALGLLVVVGVSTVFLSSRQANRSSDSLGRLQETLRTSFELMARDLREVGGNPCDAQVRAGNVISSVAASATPAWYADWGNQLHGYDAGDVFAGAAIGVAVGQRVAGTDAVSALYVQDVGDLTVAAHNTGTATFTVNNSPPGIAAGDLAMACDYKKAALFQASSVGATTVGHALSAGSDGNCSSGLGLPTICTATGSVAAFDAGAKIGRLVGVGWFVGNNGRAASGGRSLYRVTRSGVEEVADGVTDLQLQYLLSTGTDYVDASAIPAAGWDGVIGIRVTLTLASTDATVSTSASGRIQRPLSFTLSLRNRL